MMFIVLAFLFFIRTLHDSNFGEKAWVKPFSNHYDASGCPTEVSNAFFVSDFLLQLPVDCNNRVVLLCVTGTRTRRLSSRRKVWRYEKYGSSALRFFCTWSNHQTTAYIFRAEKKMREGNVTPCVMCHIFDLASAVFLVFIFGYLDWICPKLVSPCQFDSPSVKMSPCASRSLHMTGHLNTAPRYETSSHQWEEVAGFFRNLLVYFLLLHFFSLKYMVSSPRRSRQFRYAERRSTHKKNLGCKNSSTWAIT